MNRTLVETVPLFAGIPGRHHGEVAALADEITVPAGRVLTQEGSIAREFFIVLDGTAEVTKGAEPLATLGPGDFFGELGLFGEPVRTATVEATTPLDLLVLSGREFGALVERFPSVAARVQAAAEARAG